MARRVSRPSRNPDTTKQVVQAVFSAGESVGVTDRALLEQLTEKLSERLSGAVPFPGMEGFVAPEAVQPQQASTRHRATPTPAVAAPAEEPALAARVPAPPAVAQAVPGEPIRPVPAASAPAGVPPGNVTAAPPPSPVAPPAPAPVLELSDAGTAAPAPVGTAEAGEAPSSAPAPVVLTVAEAMPETPTRRRRKPAPVEAPSTDVSAPTEPPAAVAAEVAPAAPAPARRRRKQVETPVARTGEPAATTPALSANAARVLERRYLKKGADGAPCETAEQLFRRVAHHVAQAEARCDPPVDPAAWEERFYAAMTRLDFLPNSPTLMNAGRELGQLSACFVIPVEDSMESIFDAVKNTALIHKSGGGTGFSFSRLRPERDRVGSTGGVASGPLSFMQVFDKTTEVIKQGGMRRGANMAILDVTHPDVRRFISAKKEPGILTNFNLSVGITDGFMQALVADGEYDLLSPRTGEAVERVRAKDVFDQIVDMAWLSGDPGIVFMDEINRYNPTPLLGRIESTNPCGEQPLLPYESCNLGSINLALMVDRSTTPASVDFARLDDIVRLAVRFLDDVIDVNEFPLPEIGERTRRTRKIGLGVMGFADMLLQLGIPYNSEEAIAVAEKVMGFISTTANEASQDLAAERGVFPAFEGSVYDVEGGPRYRNASRTTIAPTGSLSIIANCSSGIEPLFALTYVRRILDREDFLEVNPHFEQEARERGFHSDELMRALAGGKRLADMEGIPEDVVRTFVCAYDVTPEWHVRMQAAFQHHTDSAVSKTVNFPRTATRDDVASVYLMAYEKHLKGITIYRDGSRQDQVLTTGAARPDEKPAVRPRPRPKVTRGTTERVNTGCGNMYVTINFDDVGPCEAFATLGKAGGCAAAQLEGISRLVSNALRCGIDIGSVVKNLRGIRCPSISWEQGKAVMSCADAIAGVLEKYAGEEPRASLPQQGGKPAGQCPECGGSLIHQEGCSICTACGYTKCS